MDSCEPAVVNDVHSALNATRVRCVHKPASVAGVQQVVRETSSRGGSLAIAGGRHSMGGQQFATASDLLDMTGLNSVLDFDAERGEVEVEAGLMWPALITWLLTAQGNEPRPWTIVQKQTGADELTVGGAVSSNVHGRVLGRGPIVADVAALTLVDADGDLQRCSRGDNSDLFGLASGGYGLYGPLVSVRLRLTPRRKVRRDVSLLDVGEAIATLEAAADAGSGYGDFQFGIDPAGADFLREGICSCYRPVPDDTPIPGEQRALSRQDWESLYYLAHVDPRRATDMYIRHYQATDGQIYWSDLHQLADYHAGYHDVLDRRLGAPVPGSEMITELYVPREELASFMSDVADDFRAHATQVIYGTVRLIEPDVDSFLAWATRPWACIVFNLHVDHSPSGIERAEAEFRRLIDHALFYGGSYYLTYHRWATPDQLEMAYPKFRAFLAKKRRYDPAECFQSDWYRHYRALFQGGRPEMATSS